VPAFRDIVRRIDSIRNTQKITKAMQVVAATRLRRAQAAVQATRPYSEKMLEVLQTVGERATEYKHPFLVRREGKRAVMILVTTDKGLCGAINVNNIRAATRYMNQTYPTHQQYVTLGRKGRDFLLRYRREVLAEVSNLPDRPSVGEVLPAVTVALEEYAKGNTDAVILCYSKWISTMKQEPPVDLRGSVLYHCGPVVVKDKDGWRVTAAGRGDGRLKAAANPRGAELQRGQAMDGRVVVAAPRGDCG